MLSALSPASCLAEDHDAIKRLQAELESLFAVSALLRLGRHFDGQQQTFFLVQAHVYEELLRMKLASAERELAKMEAMASCFRFLE